MGLAVEKMLWLSGLIFLCGIETNSGLFGENNISDQSENLFNSNKNNKNNHVVQETAPLQHQARKELLQQQQQKQQQQQQINQDMVRHPS